ncbi:TetR/AcrR family transcriptional regulator [Photobacterium sagamiensis]|uniref:TetR/AcrR family transcriptional regulator n=1 Tax=Photobacterium sagamiensis TaxID=2910241 RepID=UPI003D0EFB93
MPRVSQAEAAKTRQKIIEVAFDIIMNEGFENFTFSKVTKRVGITRSGINAHFKLKSDLLAELTPLFSAIISKPLIFSSPELFFTSWVYAINNNNEFIKAIVNAEPVIPKSSGLNRLLSKIKGDSKEVECCIYMSIGYAVMNLPNAETLNATRTDDTKSSDR